MVFAVDFAVGVVAEDLVTTAKRLNDHAFVIALGVRTFITDDVAVFGGGIDAKNAVFAALRAFLDRLGFHGYFLLLMYRLALDSSFGVCAPTSLIQQTKTHTTKRRRERVKLLSGRRCPSPAWTGCGSRASGLPFMSRLLIEEGG